MMASMKHDIGKRLYIDSGYRSPGYQAYLFIKYLITEHNYSLLESAQDIAALVHRNFVAQDNALQTVWALALSNTPENMSAVLHHAGAQLGLCPKPEAVK